MAAERGRRARILLAAGALVAGSLVADLVLRLALAPRLQARPEDALLERRPELPLLHRYRPLSRFDRVCSGDLAALAGARHAAEPRRVEFAADAGGFPNRPGSSLAAARLVVLGDSFGAGTGTTRERTWARLLDRPERPVHNLSVPGTPWQEYATLALACEGEAPAPGAVVLWQWFGANDLDDAVWVDEVDLDRLPRNGAAGRARVRAGSFVRRSPLLRLVRSTLGADPPPPRVLERPFLDGRPILFHADYAVRAGRSADEVRRHPRFSLLVRTVEAAAGLARARGLELRVVLVPSKEEVYGWVLAGEPPWSTGAVPTGFAAAVAPVVAAAGLELLDLGPALAERSRLAWERDGELLYWRDDTHFNERGHREAAGLIERSLERRPR